MKSPSFCVRNYVIGLRGSFFTHALLPFFVTQVMLWGFCLLYAPSLPPSTPPHSHPHAMLNGGQPPGRLAPLGDARALSTAWGWYICAELTGVNFIYWVISVCWPFWQQMPSVPCPCARGTHRSLCSEAFVLLCPEQSLWRKDVSAGVVSSAVCLSCRRLSSPHVFPQSVRSWFFFRLGTPVTLD